MFLFGMVFRSRERSFEPTLFDVNEAFARVWFGSKWISMSFA